MSGVWWRRRTRAQAAALGAVLLALLGAAGIGPRWQSQAGDVAILSDDSPSCDSAEKGTSFQHSDLLQATREAIARGARRVVLHTDGCDTTGLKAANPGVPVDVVLRPRRDNVGVQSMRVPARIEPGEPFSIAVEVGRTAVPGERIARLVVRLTRDGEAIGSPQEVAMKPGTRRSVAFVDQVPRGGVVRYRAQIDGGPGGPEDDRFEAVARVGDRAQIVVFGAAPAWAGAFELTPWRAGNALDGFDAILVNDPAPTPQEAERIDRFVRSGGGLLALGHPASLASLLPLTDQPPDGRAAVLLVDVSGSMERHIDAIRAGFIDLAARLAPHDRIALILFRDQVVHSSEWVDATQAETLWRSIPARGNTRLAPAVQAAIDLLGKAKARHRRLYVVSDGEWSPDDVADVARQLQASGAVHQAALFVSKDAPPESRALFAVHAVATAEPIDLMLAQLEAQAPDRWVRDEVRANVAAVPAWFRGAVRDGETFSGFARLYPKGEGESIALAASGIPLVAVRSEGGRIVQAATADAIDAAALRACVRNETSVELRAEREGRAAVFRARGSGGAAFRVGDRTVEARATAADRWEARLAPAPPQSFTVECAGALCVVPAAESAELAGLHPNEEFAAALARVSGGRFARDVPPTEWSAASTTRAAASVTLLCAALLVVVAAFLRRG